MTLLELRDALKAATGPSRFLDNRLAILLKGGVDRYHVDATRQFDHSIMVLRQL